MKKIFLAILLVCGVSTGALAKSTGVLICGPYVMAIERNKTELIKVKKTLNGFPELPLIMWGDEKYHNIMSNIKDNKDFFAFQVEKSTLEFERSRTGWENEKRGKCKISNGN